MLRRRTEGRCRPDVGGKRRSGRRPKTRVAIGVAQGFHDRVSHHSSRADTDARVVPGRAFS